MYSVLLVDDHILFRDGLLGLFDQWDDFKVIGEAANGAEAIEFCEKSRPDLVLMDITMPGMDGLEATQNIRKRFPLIRVVLLTVSEDEKNLFRALELGTHGYILKNTPARRFRDMLRGVMNGEAAVSGPVAARIFDRFSCRSTQSNATGDYQEKLSDRELEILQYVAEGLSNTEIAEKLFISEATVKKYLCIILDKLHLKNRVQAAVYAVKKGLLKDQ